jgi:hypothetical protein
MTRAAHLAPHRKKITAKTTMTKRLCLGGCDQLFDSWGIENRRCAKCAERQRQEGPPAHVYRVRQRGERIW